MGFSSGHLIGFCVRLSCGFSSGHLIGFCVRLSCGFSSGHLIGFCVRLSCGFFSGHLIWPEGEGISSYVRTGQVPHSHTRQSHCHQTCSVSIVCGSFVACLFFC